VGRGPAKPLCSTRNGEKLGRAFGTGPSQRATQLLNGTRARSHLTVADLRETGSQPGLVISNDDRSQQCEARGWKWGDSARIQVPLATQRTEDTGQEHATNGHATDSHTALDQRGVSVEAKTRTSSGEYRDWQPVPRRRMETRQSRAHPATPRFGWGGTSSVRSPGRTEVDEEVNCWKREHCQAGNRVAGRSKTPRLGGHTIAFTHQVLGF
jgi:hypothetical protein